jgi:hypothetical protein
VRISAFDNVPFAADLAMDAEARSIFIADIGADVEHVKAALLGKKIMTSLRQAWATLQPRLKILEPVQFSSDHWSLIERGAV